jgi:hypothetical protein
MRERRLRRAKIEEERMRDPGGEKLAFASAAWIAAALEPGAEGDMSKAPACLVELHNRLATITA